MDDKDNPEPGLPLRLPQTSASDLRGRQSVRATFKLTEKSIEALTIVSTHLGIKQKSLFDHLMEDMEALQAIARSIQEAGFSRSKSIQKTYVLSRKTLSSLELASKSFDTPRDALVEFSIQRLLPLIVKEKKRHLERKKILAQLAEHSAAGSRLLEQSGAVLGEGDAVYQRLEAAVRALQNAHADISAFVQKGSIIEDF